MLVQVQVLSPASLEIFSSHSKSKAKTTRAAAARVVRFLSQAASISQPRFLWKNVGITPRIRSARLALEDAAITWG